MNCEGAVLDDDAGPELGPKRFVRDQPAASLCQEMQDVPGGNGRAPAVTRQSALGGSRTNGPNA